MREGGDKIKNINDWRKEQRKYVHIIVLIGLVGMILVEIIRQTNNYGYLGFLIIIFYCCVIYYDLHRKKPSKYDKLLTIISFGMVVFPGIAISIIFFSPYPVGFITFLLIQGFIWVSSCLLLDKIPSYRDVSSVEALRLLYKDFSDTAKHYITVGSLIMVGVGAGFGIGIFRDNGSIESEVVILIAISIGYFTILLSYGIIFIINKFKDEIIEKIDGKKIS